MSALPPVDPARLGWVTYQAGNVYGGRRMALAPAEALWAKLKRLVALDPVTYVEQSGIPRRRTRFDQGDLQGRIRATAEALACELLGHDIIFGDAGQLLERLAVEEAGAEALAASPQGSGEDGQEAHASDEETREQGA
jgi:hypothetical protein